MRVSDILGEQDIEIDDVRWYLATDLAARLLEYHSRPAELARLIWSGKLEAELYRADERFLETLQRKADSGAADEHGLREIALQIAREKRRRKA